MKRLLATIMAAVAMSTPATPANATYTPHRDWVFPRGLAYAPNDHSCYTYRCVWDAEHQANGRGVSLIITRWGDRWTFKQITHRRAHRLHHFYCERKNVTCRGYDD